MGIKLGNICRFQSGGTPSKGRPEFFNGTIPWITTTALNGGNIGKESAVDWISEQAIKESAAKIVPAFSIMVGTRVGVGKVAINTMSMSTSQDIISLLNIDESIWSKAFLCKFLQAKGTFLNAQARGATIKGIKIDVLSELELPEIPIEEQQHISQIIDKVKTTIAIRQSQLQKLDELVKARFVELFGDPELNPRGLPVLPWNAVFLTTTGKLDSNAMVENGRYPFFTCAKESYKIDSYAFDCEALLLAGNNAAGIYDVKHYKGKFNAYQRTYVLRLMNEKWSYILFKRQLEDKLQYLQSQSKGTNTRYLTLGILNELRFVVPPVAEQEQFAVFVEQSDKSKVTVQKALDEAQLLFDSLMQKYFG